MSEFSETTVRVRYKETDQMGVVYYGNYFTYFEIGRVEYLRDRGMAYKEMEQEDDSYIVVAESHCRYLRPARYDDVLRIRTRVRGRGAARCASPTRSSTTRRANCWRLARRCTSSATRRAGPKRCRKNTGNCSQRRPSPARRRT